MRTLLPILVALPLLALSACGDSFSYDAASYFPEDWQDTYTEQVGCKQSSTHGDDYVIVYTSPEATAAYTDRAQAMPEGAVILKEQFSDSSCSTLSAITSMRKLADGEDTANGDYGWQRVESDGTVAFSGAQPGNCSTCHSACPDGDFLCEPQP
jgi:hypothetical protein